MTIHDDLADYIDITCMKYDIGNKGYKINTIIGIVLNIIVILGLSAFAYFKHFKIAEYTILMLVGYVVFDWIMLLVEWIVLRWFKKRNDERLERDKEAFRGMTSEEQEEVIKKLKKQRSNVYREVEANYNCYGMYDVCVDKIDRVLDAYGQIREEQAKKTDAITDAITKRYVENVKYVENILDGLKKRKKNYPEDIQEKIDEVVDASNDLIGICREEPILVEKLMKTFNVYLVELITILDAHSKLTDEEQKLSLDKVYTVFDVLLDHLESMKTKIQADNKASFNLSADLLIETLKEENEREKEEK